MPLQRTPRKLSPEKKGQWFSAIDGFKVYLLGHPLIWWGNLVVLAAFVLVYCHHSYASQRGLPLDPQTKGQIKLRPLKPQLAGRERTLEACGWLALAWALHYLPFYAMGRILYFHHYFPALLFSSMLTGGWRRVILDYLFESLPGLVPSYLSAQLPHLTPSSTPHCLRGGGKASPSRSPTKYLPV
ncbi:Protein O-mannosyl-transferase 2 [Chionoecetes opilio]|uniref:Protein O-mannosyl-transferase 2 n=1 Tax=Chionoecetes opilio TaxID=41210 RepID=A0A8J5CZ84_CHIOP|nr:Protein O-mannosyl-transferase 2 [Chionoecetes opilio]